MNDGIGIGDGAGTSASAATAGAFRFVSDVLRTASTLLQSADPHLGDRGFNRYDWDNAWPLDRDRRLHPSRRERFLPWLLFRHFHRPHRFEEEVLSLVVVPFVPGRPAFREAAFLASYMPVRDVPDEIYVVAAMQAFERQAPLDGVARRLGADPDRDGGFDDGLRAVFERVAGGCVVGAGVPLMDVRDTDDLLRVVDAVLRHPDTDGGQSPRPGA